MMESSQKEEPRSEFLHGSDCEVDFVYRKDNSKALVDVFLIKARGEVFTFNLMKMRSSDGPWVFGSFSRNGNEDWKFKTDKRVQSGFRGGVYTLEHKDKTYALFESGGDLVYAVPFVPMLFGEDPLSVDMSILQELAHKAGLKLDGQIPQSPEPVPNEWDHFKWVLGRMMT